MKYTKAMRQADYFRRMSEAGFTYSEAHDLRRIQMTLHRWAEAECNGEIERDEKTNKPYRIVNDRYQTATNPAGCFLVPDRETGALKRAKAILSSRNARAYVNGICDNPAAFYHQGDPRGCALYIVTGEQMKDRFEAWKTANVGKNPSQYDFAGIDSLYNRGLACDY